MLWEVEILPIGSEKDYEGQRVLASARSQGIAGLKSVISARTFLIQGELTQEDINRAADQVLVDSVTEQFHVRQLPASPADISNSQSPILLNVLLHPGVTDRPIAFDPVLPASAFESIGVRSVSLEELMRTSDFVSVHCPLNDKTRGLIGAKELQWMKSDAYLLNTARGGIVDEDPLYDLLKSRRIAGAALDCFAVEPVITPHRFGDLDNVLLAPHSIAWTHEMFRDIGRTASQSMLDLSLGNWPHGVLNPELKSNPEFLPSGSVSSAKNRCRADTGKRSVFGHRSPFPHTE